MTLPVIQLCNPFSSSAVLLPTGSGGHGWHGHLAVGHTGGGALAVRLHLHHLHHHLHVLAWVKVKLRGEEGGEELL